MHRSGFSVLRELRGHSVGRTIHQEPRIPDYLDFSNSRRLHEGLVVAMESTIAAGGRAAFSIAMGGACRPLTAASPRMTNIWL